MAPSRPLGYVAAALCAASAGACIVAGKESLDRVAPLTLAFWIFVFALPMIAVTWSVTHRSLRPPPVRGRALGLLLLHSAFGFGAIWMAWEAVDLLDPTIAGFVSRLEVLGALVLGMWLLGERFGRWSGIGAALTVAGTVVLGWPAEGAAPTEGVVLMAVSSVGFALMEMVAKVAVREIAPAVLAFYRNGILVVAFGIAAVARGLAAPPPAEVLGAVALTALLGPVLGRLWFLVALRHLELSWTALLTQTSPLFTAVVAWLVRGEIPERAMEWVGGAIILLGSVQMVLGGRAAALPAAPE